MESRCTLGFQATGLPYFYRFGWCLPWRHQEWPPRCVLVPSNWFATLRVIATRIVKRSVKGSLLYFYRFGWCLLWLFWVPRQLVVDLVGDSHEDRQGKCDGLFAIFLSVWLVSALTSSRLTTSTCIFGARQSFCDRWKWLWVTFQGTLSCLIHEGWRVLIIRTTMFTIVNQDQLLRQIKQNSKHDNNGFNQWLEILAVEDLSAKLRKSGKSDLKFSTISEWEGDN